MNKDGYTIEIDGPSKEKEIIPNRLSIGIGVTGELEGSFDSPEVSGSLEVEFTVTGEWEQQFMVGPVPAVVEIEVEGSLSATGELILNFSKEAEEKIKGTLEAAIGASVSLFAGVGVANIVSIGVYGEVGLEFGFVILPAKNAGLEKISWGGTLGLKAQALFLEAELPLLEGDDFVIYQRKKKYEGNSISSPGMSMSQIESALVDMDNYTISPLTSTSTRTEWLGANVTDTKGTIQTLQGAAYDMMTPKLVTAGDTTLLIYEDEDTNASIANRSRIKYSVYKNGKFNTPAYVENTGFSQCGVDVYSNGENIYIIWQEAKQSLADDVTLLDTAKAIELKAAKYDSATGRFVSLGTITNNNMYESQPQISADDNGVYAVWSENSVNNVFGVEGTNKIYKSAYNYAEGSWNSSVVVEDVARVDALDMGMLSGEIHMAYADNESGTGKIVNISTDASSLIPNATNVQFGYAGTEEAVIWHNGSNLMYADEMGTAGNVLYNKSTVLANSYQYISDTSGNNSIVYSYTNEGKSQVYMSDYDPITKEWGNVQAITNQNEYLENVTGTYSNGELVLAFNQTQATVTEETVETENDLCCMKIGKETKLTLEEVNYNLEEVIPGGEVKLNLLMANKGLRTIKAEDILITVTDENGKVKASATASKSIIAGTKETQEVVLNLPYALVALDYNINVSCNGNNMNETITLGYADLTINPKVCVDHGEYEVRASIGNNGVEAADGKVIFYNKYDENQIFGEESFDAVNYGEKAEVVCKLDDSIYDGSKSLTVGMRIETPATQSNTDNDTTGIYLAGRKSSNPYLVIFDYDIEGYENVRKYVEEGKGVKFPETPVKAGYKFLGWYNGNVKYTETTSITENITLVAKYEKIKEPEKKPTVNNDKLPKVNSTITKDGIIYKVTKSNKTVKTVSVQKLSNMKKTSVKIPATIKIEGYTYKVTEISKEAFKNAKKLKSITIVSNNITKVGKNAFKNIHKKAKIYVPSKMLKKYTKLFKNKGQAKTVKIKCILPKKNTKKVIGGIGYKITKSSKTNGTVSVYSLVNKNKTSVTIPQTIKIDGYKFKVTVIEKNAFKNAKKLKMINIKTLYLKAVGKNAFKNINKNAKIKVPASKFKAYRKLLKNKGQAKKVSITK
ncbi:MAG: hypothetical protein E7270_12210 [Lachnospiraceae bacterium]|nr:hypothetical protein [Lachnospiraceae bacterium]